jgi:signal transduction histidine kinase
MTTRKLVYKVRPALIRRSVFTIARGEGAREDFEAQLVHFFDLLEQAVDTGDPSWMDPIIREWSTSRTETDLSIGEHNAVAVLSQIIQLTYDVARESLPSEQALDMIVNLSPYYTHCLAKAGAYDMESRVDYIAGELKNTEQKLEKLDKSKSNFIAVAAHELKTPLTLIEGYSSMLGDVLPKEQESSVSILLDGIHTGIHRLREIVDDMIDVSLIDNNLLSLNLQPMWLNRIFSMLSDEAKATLTERKLSLKVESFTGSEELIFADPERIYQAFRNLINNAIKYTPDGGSITVSGRTLPGFIETTISDSGIGINSEDQALIFEKFEQIGKVQLHSSGKTKFKGGGPGLGLPITRGIIEAHGGAIWVESPGFDEEKCPGSVFHVLLPLRSQAVDPRLSKLFSEETTAK